MQRRSRKKENFQQVGFSGNNLLYTFARSARCISWNNVAAVDSKKKRKAVLTGQKSQSQSCWKEWESFQVQVTPKVINMWMENECPQMYKPTAVPVSDRYQKVWHTRNDAWPAPKEPSSSTQITSWDKELSLVWIRPAIGPKKQVPGLERKLCFSVQFSVFSRKSTSWSQVNYITISR